MPITRTGGLARSSGKTTKLSEIDYTIIRQMQDDSRLSANELSRDAKLPHYTVRRHLDRLLEENIITPLILAQPGLSGYSEGEAFLKVKQEHLNQVWDSLQRHPSLADYVSVIQGDYNIVASIWGKSDADLERLAEYDFGTLRGVQSCDLLIHESSETGRITGQSEGTKPARSIVTTPEIPSCLRIFGMPGSWLPPISIPRGQRNGKRGTSQMQLTARNQSRRRKLTG
jgi:DNA-binding Lrp family transcriptional regulator